MEGDGAPGEPGTAVASGATHGDGPLRPGTVLPAQGKGSQLHSCFAPHCWVPLGLRAGPWAREQGGVRWGAASLGEELDVASPCPCLEAWGAAGDTKPGVAPHYPNPQPGLGRNFPFPNRGWGRRALAPAPSSPSPRPSQLRKAPATFGSGKVLSKRLPGERR